MASEPTVEPIRAALDAPTPAPVMALPGDVGPDLADGKRERPPFPPASPVRPLGMESDLTGKQTCYYLNFNGQLVGLEANNRHGALGLIALYGPTSDFLEANWPQWSAPQYEGRGKERRLVKQAEIVGFDQREAARAHVEECVRRGIFKPSGRLRGVGAHRLGTRGLVLHYGDTLLASDLRVDGTVKGYKWHGAGLFEGNVYQAAQPVPRPWHEPPGTDPGEKLLQLLRRWPWRRSLVDPRFLLGWIGAAYIGGALDWRPNLWLTGGAGTGKSTLNGRDAVLHQLFGDALFRTGNASAAAIRQSLKNSTVPVLFDEIEAEADNRRVKEVVELARVSSSGDTVVRGGADHNAHEFTLASCFLFSSILIPPLQAQDRSRLGILELEPFAPGAVAPVLADWNLPELGRQLQARMIDGWARLADVRQIFMQAMSLTGHNPRACTQFGTLLACAHILLHDGLPSEEEANEWADRCRPESMAEISEATSEEADCLAHMLTSQVQARGGDEREALGAWIGQLVEGRTLPLLGGAADGVNPDPAHADKLDKRLQNLGLKIVNAAYKPEQRDTAGKVTRPASWGAVQFHPAEPGFVAVAGKHQGLSGIYRDTKWSNGVWRQALSRYQPQGAVDGVKVKFGHQSQRAVLVPLHVVLDESLLPAASKPEAARQWIEDQKKGAGA